MYFFAELFFGIFFITVSPTITAQHFYEQHDISGVYITILRGAYLQFTAYMLGAVVALLQLVLTIRAIENDRVGDHTFTINVTEPYQVQSASIGGYQSLSDAPVVQQSPTSIPPHSQPQYPQSSYPPPSYPPVPSAPSPAYTTTNPNAPYQSGTTQEEYKL